MNGVDAFNIARKGVTLEELVPSQNMNDATMDGIEVQKYKEEVGEIFKIGNGDRGNCAACAGGGVEDFEGNQANHW